MGAIFSIIGFVITLVINILFIPRFSYWACAYASLASYVVMALLSYFIGQRYYNIAYPLKSIGIYTLLAAALWAVSEVVEIDNIWLRLAFRTLLLAIFVAYLIRTDLPLSSIPILKRFSKK